MSALTSCRTLRWCDSDRGCLSQHAYVPARLLNISTLRSKSKDALPQLWNGQRPYTPALNRTLSAKHSQKQALAGCPIKVWGRSPAAEEAVDPVVLTSRSPERRSD